MQLHPLPPQPELNIQALERTLELSNLTNSYKLYWFAALLDEINACSAEITFRRMAAGMISKCWYSVLQFKLSLGTLDMLHRLVHYLHKKYNLDIEINETDLKTFLLELKDEEYEKCIVEFCRYVPYRLLTPFYPDQLHGKPDAQKNRIIEELSCVNDTALYRIRSRELKIEVNYNWFEYLYCNMSIVTGWYRYRLIEYLQKRNPNTPSVIDKISPPLTRDLGEAKKFWKTIISAVESPPPGDLGGHGIGNRESVIAIKDIYTGQPVNESDMSIDHFIPWSFVLHDRLWNLTPVSKSINSRKSDLLPPLERYLDSFINLQYTALTTAINLGYKKNKLEDYLMLGEGIDLTANIDKSKFKELITNTITPLHRIAQNQGFGLWTV